MRIAGHCVRYKEEEASKLVLWQAVKGKRKRGRRAVTYIDTLMGDTGLGSTNELKIAMLDREEWRRRGTFRRAEARPK